MLHPRRLAAFFAAVVALSGLIPIAASEVAAAATNTVAVGDLNLVESDVGVATVKVPITLSTPSATTVAVKYVVSAGTASSPTDFKTRKGTAKFKPGVVDMTAAIKILGDGAVEPNETINVQITGAVGATVSDGLGVVTLADNDANGVAAAPEVSAGRPAVQEGDAGNRAALVPIRLSRPGTTNVTVRFDNGCQQTNVKFKPGQMLKNVAVPVLPNVTADGDYTIPNAVQVTAGAASTPAPTAGVDVRDDDGAAHAQPVGSTIRASETSRGTAARYPAWACEGAVPGSQSATISANGRFVAFDSQATNLVLGDTNGKKDVYVKDLWTGAIERVSPTPSGAQATEDSTAPTISPDGRFVLFDRWTYYAWPAPQWGWLDTFIFDRTTHTVAPLFTTADHTAIYGSTNSSISADNRYVAFWSLVPFDGDTDTSCDAAATLPCQVGDIFVIDRTTGVIKLVTTGLNGTPDFGGWPAISADGRSIAYRASGPPGTDSGHVWVSDWMTGTTELVSANSAGQPLQGWGIWSDQVSISADGRQVLFTAEACNLGVACAPNGRSTPSVYVRNRDTGKTTVESAPAMNILAELAPGASLSADGRYVVFNTTDPNVLPGWTDACIDNLQVIVRDRVTRALARASSSRFGGCAHGRSTSNPIGPSISADGSFVAFTSDAGDIVNRDGGIDPDVFVYRVH